MVLASDDASTKDRRAEPRAPRHGGKRWRDDPDLNDAVSRVLQQASRDVYGLRQCMDVSQDAMAAAAGVARQTLKDIEKIPDDIHVSTLVRLAFVAGFEVDIRFRRPRRPAYRSRLNPALTSTSR